MSDVYFDAILEYRWRWGGPRDIWLKNSTLIESLINSQKLKPTDVVMFPTQWNTPAPEATVVSRAIKRPPFPGGIKLAHLHYKDQLYMLTDAQWKSFTQELVKSFKERLAKTQVLSFEKTMELSEAIDTVPIPD